MVFWLERPLWVTHPAWKGLIIFIRAYEGPNIGLEDIFPTAPLKNVTNILHHLSEKMPNKTPPSAFNNDLDLLITLAVVFSNHISSQFITPSWRHSQIFFSPCVVWMSWAITVEGHTEEVDDIVSIRGLRSTIWGRGTVGRNYTLELTDIIMIAIKQRTIILRGSEVS